MGGLPDRRKVQRLEPHDPLALCDERRDKGGTYRKVCEDSSPELAAVHGKQDWCRWSVKEAILRQMAPMTRERILGMVALRKNISDGEPDARFALRGRIPLSDGHIEHVLYELKERVA